MNTPIAFPTVDRSMTRSPRAATPQRLFYRFIARIRISAQANKPSHPCSMDHSNAGLPINDEAYRYCSKRLR